MGSSGANSLPELFQATDQGSLYAWSYDPATVANGVLISGGVLYTVKALLRSARTVGRLWISISNPAVGATANQCFLALYDSAGTRVGVTASQHTAFGSAQILGAPLTAPVLCPAGSYYIGILANAAVSPPTLLCASVLNLSSKSVGDAAMVAADGYRFGFTGAALTSAPATITPATIDPNISATIWAGVGAA